MRRLLSLLTVVLLLAPASGEAQVSPRSLHKGQIYLGTAPGVNFGGHSLPRDLYMDALQVGYVFSNGIDLSYSLSGMNWFPDEGDYAITMNRFALGWRPFLADPLPMVQPYVMVGAGIGGEGRYLCEPEPDCDPATNECRNVCGRANWVGSFFAGGGLEFNSWLFDMGSQQVLLYVGAQLRYEWVGTRYHMGVVSFPIGLKLL